MFARWYQLDSSAVVSGLQSAVFPVNKQFVMIGEPSEMHMPPPLLITELFVKEQFTNIGDPEVLRSPPPFSNAVLPLKLQFVTVGEPASLLIPPPKSAELSVKVQ